MQADAQRLLEAVMAVSRRPSWYGPEKTPDTLEGRFEAMTLNGCLALIRLRAAPEAEALAQRFVDTLFRHFDAGLREAAVGDLTVPKKMRALAGAFYGRLEAYAAGLAAGEEALAEALARNMGVPAAFAARLAGHVRAVAAAQAAAPVEALAGPEGWPAFAG